MKNEKITYINKHVKNYINELIIGYKNMFNDLNNKEIKKHIPNMITTARIGLGVTSFAMMLLNIYHLAVPLFIVGAITDCVDGFVARKFNLKSDFGAKLDAFADKLFVLGPTIILSIQNIFMLPILLGETAIVVINTKSYINQVPVTSSKCGKVKTIFLFLTLSTELLSKLIPVPIIQVFRNILITLTVLFQLSTAVGYDEKYNTSFQEKGNIKIEIKKMDLDFNGDEEIFTKTFTDSFAKDIAALEKYRDDLSGSQELSLEPNKTKTNDI